MGTKSKITLAEREITIGIRGFTEDHGLGDGVIATLVVKLPVPTSPYEKFREDEAIRHALLAHILENDDSLITIAVGEPEVVDG